MLKDDEVDLGGGLLLAAGCCGSTGTLDDDSLALLFDLERPFRFTVFEDDVALVVPAGGWALLGFLLVGWDRTGGATAMVGCWTREVLGRTDFEAASFAYRDKRP